MPAVRKDSTWSPLPSGRKQAGTFVYEKEVTTETRGFNITIPRSSLPNQAVASDVVKVTAEYSTDGGKTWNLIVGATIASGEIRRRDGSIATESDVSIVLLDTVRTKEPDPINSTKIIDWYSVVSRTLTAGSIIRATLDVLVACNLDCIVAFEEGPSVLQIKEPLHHSVAFDAASSSSGNGVTSLTWAHTCTGSNRGLVVGVGNYGTTIVSVTYNSVSMTSEGGIIESSSGEVEQFSLIAPATGSNNIVVSFVDSVDAVAGGVSVTGANQTDLCGTQATAIGNDTAPTVNVTSAVDELVVDVTENWTGVLTVGSGQTERWNTGITNINCGGSTEPGATTVTMSWSKTDSTDWAIAGISIKAAPTGSLLSGQRNNLGALLQL